MTDTNNDGKAEDVNQSTDGQASDDQGTKTEDQGGGSNEGGVDYKAELDKVTKQLTKAEHKLEENRKGGDSKDDKKQVDQDQVEKLATEKAQQIATERINEFSTGLVTDTVDEALAMYASNDDERKLIQHHYDNTIQKSGLTRTAILSDLRRCKLLANENATGVQIDELTAALRSEQGKNKSGLAAGERKGSEAKIVLTPSEETLAQRMYERSTKVGKTNSQGKPYQLEDARRELFNAKDEQ